MTDKTIHAGKAKNEGSKEDIEMLILDLTTIAYATNNFLSRNKNGEGGLGQYTE